MMKSRRLLLLLTLALLATSAAGAQNKSRATRKASPQPAPASPDGVVEDYSGMYTFLKEGEFVQITIESGLLLGFISRTGDLDSDRGVYLDQFFDKGKISGNQISFNSQSQSDAWLISFSYLHSQHTITMSLGNQDQISTDAVPQWLLYLIPIAVVAAVAVAAVAFKSRTKKTQK